MSIFYVCARTHVHTSAVPKTRTLIDPANDHDSHGNTGTHRHVYIHMYAYTMYVCVYVLAYGQTHTNTHTHTYVYKVYQRIGVRWRGIAESISRMDRVKEYVVHARHARNVPFADVAVERRPCGIRRVEELVHARHRCGVPVGDRAVGRRRRARARQPLRRGSADVTASDGRLRSDVRGEEKEQHEAVEAVRPVSTQKQHDMLHRRATRCKAVCVASLCNEEHQVVTLRDAPL
jgi:hypothetical protein